MNSHVLYELISAKILYYVLIFEEQIENSAPWIKDVIYEKTGKKFVFRVVELKFLLSTVLANNNNNNVWTSSATWWKFIICRLCILMDGRINIS